MKKITLAILAIATLISLGSCVNKADFDDLKNRVDKIENQTIKSIDDQISTIVGSFIYFENADKELKALIENLQKEETDLTKKLNETNAAITKLEQNVATAIATEKQNILTQLENAKKAIEDEIALIKKSIADLQAKDADLEKQIADLKTYVDSELAKEKDWASATFATLEQHNNLTNTVAGIDANVQTLAADLKTLENTTRSTIEDLYGMIQELESSLRSDIAKKAEDIYAAITASETKITTEYTQAITTAINNLRTELQTWVNEQLKGYYTIAEADAKIKLVADKADANAEEIEKLKAALEAAKTELTAAYEKAISDAITANNGVINAKIESEIATVNTRITTEVAAINTKIDAILGRLDSIEDRLEAIEEQINSIQSIELIPDYSDGTTSFYKAWDWDGEAAAFAKIKLEVTPASAADAIAQAFAQDPTTIKVDAVQTKSILTPITVKDVEKIEDGIILVTAESTDESLLNNGQNHSARVKVTVGAASASSSYFSFRKNTIAISLGTTDITLSSAKTSCEVNPVSDWTIEEWGVCYSYEQTPTTLHNKIVASSTSVLNEEFIFTDLTKDTDYYYRPYVKCNDSYYFGETVAFKTLLVIPDAVIKTAAEFKDMIENKLAQGGYYRIDADIDMTGVDFDNSVNPMKSFTIDGNGHTVTGLSKAMIEGVSQGDPEFVFKNITVKNPQIAMTSGGAAAFIGWLETKPFVTFENCKVEGGKISTTGSYAAAFYGYAAGYNVLDNGPVFTDITIKNCTVSGVEIEANKSVGAICGHATGNAWTKVTIDGCTVENNTLTTKQNTHVYVGAVLGTVGAGQTNQGKDGGVWISNCTVEGNTVAWNGGTDPAQRWYGRQGTPGGVLFIDGVCPYLVKNADNSYTIENGHQLAYLASEGFNMGVNPIVLNFPANAIIDMKGISYGHGDNTTNIPAKVVINGNGATIENLEVSGRQATLIPNTAAGMEVKDITIKNSTFTGKGEDVWNDCAAAFGSFCDGAGGNAVSFSNVTIDGVTVSNSKYAGGFVAYCAGNVSSYTNCVVKNCNISSKYTEDGGASYKGHCGGFIGLCGGGTITGCSVEDTTFDVLGPRCGIFVGTSNGAAITGTASKKNISGLSENVGSVAPANFQVVVTAL